MTRTREVIHIMRDDARALWPFFAFHLTVLTYETLRVRGDWAFIRLPYFSYGAFPFYGSALLLAALLVHRHAPNSPTAHWSSLPHRRSSIWAAKWSALALMLACGTGAIILAIRDFPLPEARASLFVVIKASSLCAVYASGALVGALRKDLRNVLLLLLALPLSTTVFYSLFARMRFPVVELGTRFWQHNYAAMLLFCTALALLISRWMYREHGLSKRAAASALLVSIPLFAGAMDISRQYDDWRDSQSFSFGTMSSLSGAIVVAEPAALSSSGPASAHRQSLRVRMEGAPVDLRAQWWSTSERVTSGSPGRGHGSVEVSRTLVEFYTPELPLAPDLTWLHARGAGSARRSPNGTEWNVQTLVRSNSGVPLYVRSGVSFSKPVILARLAAKRGSRAGVGNLKFRMMQRGSGSLMCDHARLVQFCDPSFPEQSVLRLRMYRYGHRGRDLTFALVNTEQQEAIRMHAELTGVSSRLTFMPGAIAALEWSLVPEAYTIADIESPQLAIDEDWLRNAELVIVEWEYSGDVPVTTTNKSGVGAQ